MPPEGTEKTCQWVNQSEAFRHFALFAGRTESATHIKPLHWYVACRLVLEGGFHPDDITPRPPFRVHSRRGVHLLSHDPDSAGGGERTVLGGLKTKSVDVVVTREGIGPVLAVSCKGVTGAFRNLTNRMEETVGECTNLHITYPAMVVGYFAVLRANRRLAEEAQTAVETPEVLTRQLTPNDLAFTPEGELVEGIVRFHSALREMTGRRGIRNELSRYEAITIALLEVEDGQAFGGFPPPESPLRLEKFFETLYARYDERYVFSAPTLKRVTRRLEWSPESEAVQRWPLSSPGYEIREATGSEEPLDEGE